ncbi:MAG: hypothetical protein ABSB95_09720 [Dissulfurispiraceae bacterium]|jgi:hypothetical protein
MKNECLYCGAYKPAGVEVCAKCNNNPRMANALKKVSSGIKYSMVIDEKGAIVKKILGR